MSSLVSLLGSFDWENGKYNGDYRDYRGYIGVIYLKKRISAAETATLVPEHIHLKLQGTNCGVWVSQTYTVVHALA